MDDPLKIEEVTLQTMCQGQAYADFHEVLSHVVSTCPTDLDSEDVRSPWHPSKARVITLKVLVEPRDGGANLAYSIDTKIPMRTHTRGGFAHIDGSGTLVQFAARQAELPLPNVVRNIKDIKDSQ